MSGMKIARESAWARFGVEYWKLFVFGPLIAKVIGALVVVAGFVGAGLFVAENGAEWVMWADAFFSAYMLPSILVAVGVAVYAIGVVLAWRAWGWYLSFKGLKASGYTAIMSLVMIGFIAIVGVAL